MPTATDCEQCNGDVLCFKHKLRTLQFGLVPGGYRQLNSGTYIDHESILADGIPTMEETQDRRSTALRKIRELESE